MRRALLSALTLACACSVLGCSALGLDQFPQATCTTDRDCEGLPPTEDDCHTWQCDRTTMHCAIDLLDADEDGSPAMTSPSMATCVMDTTVDCDDRANAPNPHGIRSLS